MQHKIDTNLIGIKDGKDVCYGADQSWFSGRWHRASGCGPTTAALITMYMAQAFSDQCAAMYPYPLPAETNTFSRYMGEMRRFVKPGLFGLTDERVFADSVKAFASQRGVRLMAQIISPGLSVSAAYGFLQKALAERYMPALLILRNPSLKDFSWHWMAVTGYDSDKQTILVSTYAREFELAFKEVWQQQKPYRAVAVYFYPI